VEYGGAGLTDAQAKVVSRAIAKAGSMNPIPYLSGMGVTMVGPTLLEYGTPEQKARHLPGMASGEVRWGLGLSAPNAGSDQSQWCGVLVRTDRSAAKRDDAQGISLFVVPADAGGLTRSAPGCWKRVLATAHIIGTGMRG
jgi:alkylation response protein AidB-like acyl-CoA dehydrogenase